MYDADLVLMQEGQLDDYDYIVFLENTTVDMTEIDGWQKLIFNQEVFPISDVSITIKVEFVC